MRIAISQPRYLPALNYLQRIFISDRFVLLDNVQHQKRAFEHRNRVRSEKKAHWLSIPIDRSVSSRPTIRDMRIADSSWVDDHMNRLQEDYKRAPFFDLAVLNYLYRETDSEEYFVDVAEKQLLRICDFLRLPWGDKLIRSSKSCVEGTGSRLLADLTKAFRGDIYISGPNGRNYINLVDFNDVQVVYHDYSFPRYSQHGTPFIPWLAWLDCLFNAGFERTREFIVENIDLSIT